MVWHVGCTLDRHMRTYTIARTDTDGPISSLNTAWRAYAGAFSAIRVQTTDRRCARKIVRLARALGYPVKFWESK